jgi:hypothetical protein
MSDELFVSLMLEPTVLFATSATGGAFFPSRGPRSGPRISSFDEERRELLDSVLGALAANPPDPDERAACRHLLKRLAETANCPGSYSVRPGAPSHP